MSLKRVLKNFPWAALMVSLYSVLYLWQVNFYQTNLQAVLPTLGISLTVGLFVYLLCLAFFRSYPKAALASALLLVIVLFYGHIFNLINNLTVFGIEVGRHRYMLLLAGLLAGAVLFFTFRARRGLGGPLQVINVLLLALVSISVLQTGYAYAKDALTQRPAVKAETNATSSSQAGPDVYYIVLDSYSRQDVLRSTFDYDNQDFLSELQKLGFVIPDCTQANYPTTELSLASSMNMNYLEALGIDPQQNASEDNSWLMGKYIRDSQVRANLTALGYQFVAFKPVYPFLAIPDADIYVDVSADQSYQQSLTALNFQSLYLRTTLARVLTDKLEEDPERYANWADSKIIKFIYPNASLFRERNYLQYEQNLYAFDQLEKMPQVSGKKFVYAHLFTTHQPFTFNRDGSFRWPVNENSEGYVSQVVYTSQRMLKIVRTILSQSKTPPIIVIQGDHSYVKGKQRVRILNAYYLPDGGSEMVYDAITPVNTFRLIFNQYFGGQYQLLPDQSYYQDEALQLHPIEGSCVK